MSTFLALFSIFVPKEGEGEGEGEGRGRAVFVEVVLYLTAGTA
jgi:hypothetical protein